MHLVDRDLDEKAYIRSKLNSVSSRAKNKGLEFNLTAKWFRSEMKSHCPVLGTKLHYQKGSGINYDPIHVPSIDRIDPDRGYLQDNCRIISYKANALLSNGCLWEMRKVLESFEKDCNNPTSALKNSKLCQKSLADPNHAKSLREVSINSVIVKA